MRKLCIALQASRRDITHSEADGKKASRKCFLAPPTITDDSCTREGKKILRFSVNTTSIQDGMVLLFYECFQALFFGASLFNSRSPQRVWVS